MKQHDTTMWESYREQELAKVTPLLKKYGFTLAEEQVHIGGERHLFSGKKLVLMGTRAHDGRRAIIKVSSDPESIAEIERERLCRMALSHIKFAYHVFHSPEELLYAKVGTTTISITAYIEQETRFMDRPPEDQLFLALKAFDAQEGVHATTYAHTGIIRRVFGSYSAERYCAQSALYAETVDQKAPSSQERALLFQQAHTLLTDNATTIDQYAGFLTHADFVPHNIRIQGRDIYLLDHSSLRFGNKYDGWARFINFMALYNHDLEKLLTEYVQNNRTEEESLSLHCMRVFRLTELIAHHATILPHSTDDLQELTRARIDFWTHVLKATLNHRYTEASLISAYVQKRDSLRSPEEKKRQHVLH